MDNKEFLKHDCIVDTQIIHLIYLIYLMLINNGFIRYFINITVQIKLEFL